MKRETEEITAKKVHKARLEILKALNSTNRRGEGYVGFKILDKVDTRELVKKYTGYRRSGYNCVTARYIQQMILKEKYSLRVVSYVLLSLLHKEKVKTFKCKDIGEIVFHKYRMYGTRTLREVVTDRYVNGYDLMVKDFLDVTKYLRSNKIENSNN